MKEIGALYDPRSGTCTFRVWAPLRESVDVKIIAPVERIVPMDRNAKGYWQAAAQDVGPGARYLYRLDSDRDRPDPASRFLASELNWDGREEGQQGVLLAFYRRLIRLRREIPAIAAPDAELRVQTNGNLLLLERSLPDGDGVFCLFNFEHQDRECTALLSQGEGELILDSSGAAWNGPGGAVEFQPHPKSMSSAMVKGIKKIKKLTAKKGSDE